MIYTFWQGTMPSYIRLCLQTWNKPYTLLNYDNLNKYTDLSVEKLKRFTIVQACDCVRAHVLRDNGGYWLDADSIMTTGEMPKATVLGNVEMRTNTIAYLNTEAHSKMFEEWTRYQDGVLNGANKSKWWALMGNAFTDPYIKEHTEIEIGSIYDYWLETDNETDRPQKYVDYYFNHSYRPADLPSVIILHNSWTPKWYKGLTESQVLAQDCTLSNIFRELLKK